MKKIFKDAFLFAMGFAIISIMLVFYSNSVLSMEGDIIGSSYVTDFEGSYVSDICGYSDDDSCFITDGDGYYIIIFTEPPTTIPPTTIAPTTIAPTTVAPTTVPPTTIAPTTEPTTTTEAPTVPSVIWSPPETKTNGETEEIAEEIDLPPALPLENVWDYVAEMTPDQKSSPHEVDMAILFAENEIAKCAAMEITGDEFILTKFLLEDLQEQAKLLKEFAESIFLEADIEPMREIRTAVTYKSAKSDRLSIKLKPSIAAAAPENIIIQTPDYSICIPNCVILTDIRANELIITTEKITSGKSGSPAIHTFAYPSPSSGSTMLANAKFVASSQNEVQYKVTLSQDLTENIKYSFDPAPGDVNYQAVFCSDGTPIGGKYNPQTKKIDTRIRYSDIYTVKENKKDFGDILKKSDQMQEAIRMLASKGIINGTSQHTFEPDGEITRAEITAMIVRTLVSRFDENTDGKFTDVKRNKWYFGAIGTAKVYGIINGMSATIFAPDLQIKKEQIIAIAARTLRSEMKYKTPADIDKYLKKFTDKNALPDWGIEDFALASMADLIVPRTDGKFNPGATMTRGEAAMVLYRLFMKIW